MKTIALLLAAFVGVAAADYPDKPIHLIVPFAAGGGADTIARVVAEGLARNLKQPVLVENKAGGDSTIGSAFVAKSPSDGYTLLFGTNTGMSGAPALHRNIGYDPVRDFTPISQLGFFAFFLVVSPEVPVRTLRELVDYARANPGKLNYASGNAMGIVATAQLRAASNLDMVHVPYKGEAPALPDLISNRVQMLFATGFIVPHVKEGKVRAIVAVLDHRSAALPDVPTAAEAGWPDLAIRGWAGLFGPAGMPGEVIARLAKEVGEVLRLPAVHEQLALQGFIGGATTPAELAAFTRNQLERWAAAARVAGIQPD